MPYDTDLAATLRAALAGRPGISEQAMFGGRCWMLDGNMLCGVEVGRYMFRVGKALEEEALSRAGTEIVSFSGRRMGGLVWVEAESCRDGGLEGWIALAARFVGSLPRKPPKRGMAGGAKRAGEAQAAVQPGRATRPS